jgi:uncharacterized protein YqeY
MEIREKMNSDLKSAMKDRDQMKMDAIRFVQSAIKNREIELRPNPISQDEVLGVLKKMVKQRKESIEQYQSAGRKDLVDKEAAELKIIESYLPSQMGREQVEKIVADTITELKASSVKDMGAVMKAVIAKTQGAADNKLVSELVKSKLG